MRRFFERLFGHTTQRPVRQARLKLEGLEGREVPAAPIVSPQGVLTITATDKGDQILIQMDTNGTPSIFDDNVHVHWTRGDGKIEDYSFKRFVAGYYGGRVPQIHLIRVEGGAGNDTIENDTSIDSGLHGNNGNDVLRGGGGDDLLEGGKGSDVLDGNNGNDDLYALYQGQIGTDVSVDVLHGGNGIDFLFGGRRGINFLYGGDESDVLIGGENAINNLFGESSNDYLAGGNGAASVNLLVGGSGKDVLVAGTKGFNILNAVDGYSGSATADEIHPAESGYTIWYYDPSGPGGQGDHVFPPSDAYVPPPPHPA